MSQLGGYYPTNETRFDRSSIGKLIDKIEIRRHYKRYCFRHRRITDTDPRTGKRVCFHCIQRNYFDNKYQ